MEAKKRILLIEDDATFRDILAGKLERNNFLVEKAGERVAAMKAIEGMPPDCIILNMHISAEGDTSMLEWLQLNPTLKSVPVIAILNSAQSTEMEIARKFGVREFITKDVFDPSEILTKIERAFAGGTKSKEDIQKEWASLVKKESSSGGNIPPTTATSGNQKKFILVIEDDKFLRQLLVRKLTGNEFDVENAIDAGAAFAILAERKPSVILCDIILPGVDGFEILRRIKADPSVADVPVVMLSNLGQKEDLDKAMALGAKDFMIKSNFTLDEIVTKIRSLLE